MPPTPELAITGTDYNQPLAPWKRRADGAPLSALACCVRLSSVDVPVICTGWTNRLLIAPMIAQEMFCQLHPFFLMRSASLWSSVELSWREERRTGWVISQSFYSRCLTESANLAFLFSLVVFLPHLFSFFGLFFDNVLLIETVLFARFFHPCLSHSFLRDSQLASAGSILAGKDDLEMLSAVTLPMAALRKISFAHRKWRGRFSRAAPEEEGEGTLPATALFQAKASVCWPFCIKMS